jgi:hypothetical protein
LNYGNTGGNGNFYFWGGSRDLDSGDNWIGDGQWHMYTITYDGTFDYVQMYIDGNPVGSGTVFLEDAALSVHVGNPSLWNSNFRGALDEFTIWDAVLSPAQIANLMAYNVAIVPEPSAILLAVLGLLGLGVGGPRRRRR